MRAGLVSITFRQKSVAEVAGLAAEAGLECVEWGGDVHVPHGDLGAAREAAAVSADHGLSISAYGSYLRLGSMGGPQLSEVVETAAVLGAPTIRVWAGRSGSAETSEEQRAKVVEAAWEAAEAASRQGMTTSFEFHGGSLTDTAESAAALYAAVDHPAARTFWQPPNGMPIEECLQSLEVALPRLSNVHAFHWWPSSADRHPLANGADRWQAYLSRIREAGLSPDVLLEFLPGDDAAVLPREAETLRGLLGG